MIGAPDVDQVAKAAVELVLVIGDVGREISVAAVGFEQRPIDVVAKGGGAEQRLLAILVILDRRALWRRQPAFIDVALGAEIVDGLGDAVVAGFDQRPLGEEHIVLDVERGEIALDHRHHHRDRLGAHGRQPFGFRHRQQLVAMLSGQRLPDRLQIIAGIKPFRNLADVLAERLAVAQERRAREHVDLGAGIVDVIFA